MFEKFRIDLTDKTVYCILKNGSDHYGKVKSWDDEYILINSFVDGALVLISLDYLGAIRVVN